MCFFARNKVDINPTMKIIMELIKKIFRKLKRKSVVTLDELDVFLRKTEQVANDDDLRKVFLEFEMKFPFKLPRDPFSKEYRDKQFEFYEFLAGKPYSEANEESVFDVDLALAKPFPFATQSPSTVGNQLMAIGHIIKTMDLPSGSSVLEFGPGWGNTTLQLARMGYAVTAVDVEPRFIELIRRRAEQKKLEVDLRLGTFKFVDQTDEQWDAILFFECFHHCADHIELIKGLNNVIKPGGRVIFAAEPITNAFSMPWGFRLDGESLWAIRSNGWCELGFTETYFKKVMNDNGWKITTNNCTDTPWGNIFVATRINS